MQLTVGFQRYCEPSFTVNFYHIIDCVVTRIFQVFSSPFFYSQEFISQDPVRIILNKLEKRGYKLRAMTGLGQTCIWTLQKEDDV